MDILDLVRIAVSNLGDGASAEAVSRHVAERHGARVDARFVPVYRAALRAEALRLEARERAARIVEEDRRERGTNKQATAS